MIGEVNLDSFVQNYIAHEIKKLYLGYLYQLEDLVNDEFITDEKYKLMRKRVLDIGNECVRQCDSQMKMFTFQLKTK